MNVSLTGKNALVCGASQGIGRAAAIELALLGANVTLVARNAEKLEATVKELNTANGQQHHILALDLNDSAALKNAVEQQVTHTAYTILVNNNAGPAAGPITEAQPEQFINAFNNHLIANHILATALLPGMKAAGYGRIINIISTSVKVPLKNLGVSNTIRAAVANWSKTMANELAPFGITVNNVLPGTTYTQRLQDIIHNTSVRLHQSEETVTHDMQKEIPMKRFAEAAEVAAAVAFLASPAASYITGINIPVDGGRTGCL